MRFLFGLSVSLLCVPALFGCGGSGTSDDATGGTSSGGSSATGGAGATGGGGSGGSGGIGGSVGGGGSGGTPSCESFADEIPDPQTFTVRLSNKRSSPIYVGGGTDCAPSEIYELHGPNGKVALFAGGCGNTCAELQQHGPYCTGACQMPEVILIQPGGHYDASWSRMTYENVAMPASCYSDPSSASATCDRRIIPPEGTYGAIAEAGTLLSCSDVGTCTCTPDSAGSCKISHVGTPGGEIIAAKASFEFPSASIVEIEFQ